MEPRNVILHLSKYLMDFEKSEIMDYEYIYFINLLERKGKGIKSPDGIDNNGFDNDKNEYICDEHDHIAYRFEIVKKIGKGSFG
jgi:dual specificity tyrosine-phosphorylation-regulated kinase 2/3/4